MENTPEVGSEQHEPSRLKKFGWGVLQGAVLSGILVGIDEGLHVLGVLPFDVGADIAATTIVSVFAGAMAARGDILPVPGSNRQES